MTTMNLLETAVRDLHFALRTIRKNPVFVSTAVLTLALAIGGNTAMFTIIRAVLLNPLEYRDPDQLVRLSGGATPARFQEMRTNARSFTELGAFTPQQSLTFSHGAQPEVLIAVWVSGSFLRILGAAPALGRSFRPEEDSPAGAPVAMISSELWQRRFGSNPQVIGSTVNMGAAPYTIIGVLPPRFQFPAPGIDVWMTSPSELPIIPPKSRALTPFLAVFGRLKPGVDLDRANAEMKVIRSQYAKSHPAMLDAKPKTPIEVAPMKDDMVAKVRSMLWMLFGVVGFVLMIACANVANLLLTRAASRKREFAVRSALGATRSRLIGHLLAESLLISTFGGAFGVLLAALALRAVTGISALDIPRQSEIHMDWVVIGFAAALSIATGVLFGLAPSLGASQPDLMPVLRVSGATANSSGARILAWLNVRGVLSIGQVAFSVVLLIGAGLLLQSIAYLHNVNVGFNPANLLTARISLPLLRYDTDQKKISFFEQLVQRAGSIPGIHGAAVSMSIPMMAYPGTPVQDASKPPLKLNERMIAKFLPITPEYFRTFGIPLERGREFNQHDTLDAPRVAIIDESMARRFWPGYPSREDPIGQRLLIGGVILKSAEIVGVVSDIHQNLDNRDDWKESVYVSFTQSPLPSAMLTVRTGGDPLSFVGALRGQVASLDRDQPIADVRTMEERVEAQVGQRRLLLIVLGAFALVALLLTLVGIYGVMAYSVAQRVQELGIRRALGAQQRDILRLVLGQGIVLTSVGIVVGIAGAIALTRVMTAMLFEVSATDPATFTAIASLFFLVALVACYIPARRATRIDPVDALRI